MMRALYVQGLRRIASRPVVVTLLAALFACPALVQALQVDSEPAGRGWRLPIALVACAGLIGNDFRHGEIRLILARPVPRSTYLVARWLSAGTAASAVALAQYLLGCVVAAVLGMDGAPSWHRISVTGLSLATWGFVVAALVLPLSALLPGEADACLYTVLFVGLSVLRDFLREPFTARLASEALGVLMPDAEWLRAGVYYATYVLSNAAVALLLACFILTRRELPSAPPA
jgi:hypothetical protein